MKRISATADFVRSMGWFVIAGSAWLLLLSFVGAFGDNVDADKETRMLFESIKPIDQFFQGGVLFALGCITIGVGRILQVLENRNE